MSFILDALRKSEHERERRALPGLVETQVARSSRPGLTLILGGIGVLLAVNAAILAWALLRPAAPPATPLASAAPVAAAPVAASGRVRPLAAEAAAEDPTLELPEPPPVTHPRAPDPGSIAAPLAAAAQAPATPALPPTLRQLPAAVAAVMPPLNVDLHVYSASAAQRFVIINGQRVREGGVLREGMLVEQITPEGVVLNHQGTRFTLSRE